MASVAVNGFGQVSPFTRQMQSQEQVESASFHGRKVALEIKGTLSKVGRSVMTAFSLIKHNTYELSRTMKLTLRSITAFRIEALSQAAPELRKVLGWFDALYFLMDADYFLNKRYEKDMKEKPLAFVGGCQFAVANLAATALFVEEIGVVKLGAVSSSFGTVHVLGTAVKLSLGTLIKTCVGGAFALFTADALIRVCKEDDKRQALLDLCKWGLDLTAFCVGAFTTASVGTVAMIGVFGETMGLVSFLNKEKSEFQKIWAPKTGPGFSIN